MWREYEQRTRALNENVHSMTRQFGESPLGTQPSHYHNRLLANSYLSGEDYSSVKAYINELRQYKTSHRREWVVEQANLATLFGKQHSLHGCGGYSVADWVIALQRYQVTFRLSCS